MEADITYALADLRIYGFTNSVRRGLVAAILLGAALGAGCGPNEPLRIATLQLGKSLNPDNSVGTHTTRFKPDDTVYVSLLSDDPGYGTVTVRWLLNGQVVSEAKRDVSYTRGAATEFHLQNSGGFPHGNYRVEILINGQPAGSREFRVEP
jgi:hypothetical protein